MRPDHLDDLVADAVDGVQRAHRILEDHGDLLAADVAQLVVVEPVELSAAVVDRAGDPGVGGPGQTGQRLRGDALAGAGFADDRQHLARGEIERDTVDRLDHAVFGGEADPKILDRQDRAHAGAASPSRMRGSSTAYRMSTIVLNSTMKNAPNITTAISGGRSRRPDRFSGIQSDAVEVVDGLGEDRATADHQAEVEPEQRDDGNHRVA